FNIPVKHFGWYRKGNTNKDDAAIDWNAVRVGDFGMVRNHSYSVEVGKIVGLASGIGGDDVELVPPSFSQDYYMSYTVHILKWAVVPTQKVDL
ncbi:MAG: fimbria major subunit, partial [Muribaculaceae bacterium]|nr:fimbria major subunit [Muribaculaceae bacterium]